MVSDTGRLKTALAEIAVAPEGHRDRRAKALTRLDVEDSGEASLSRKKPYLQAFLLPRLVTQPQPRVGDLYLVGQVLDSRARALEKGLVTHDCC